MNEKNIEKKFNPHKKPDWAKGDGVKKKCQRCGNEFIDWTSKEKWIHCFPCWQIKRDEYPRPEGFFEKTRRTDAKSRELNRRWCLSCDGQGCDECGDGVADYPADKELFLGEEA